jgi:hypothetical protein
MQAARADSAALEAAARAEGGLTWYVAQMSGEAAEAMARRFSQRYPGIAVSAIRTTGQVAYERLQQELNRVHFEIVGFPWLGILLFPYEGFPWTRLFRISVTS